MNNSNKRMNRMDGDQSAKRVKKECSYGAACYRLNPAHFREYSHAHLESILDAWSGSGSFEVPDEHSLQRSTITEQLNILLEKKLYEPRTNNAGQEKDSACSSSALHRQPGTYKQDSPRVTPVKTTTSVPGTADTNVTHTHKHNSVKSELDKSESVKQSETSELVKENKRKETMNESGKNEKLKAGSSNREKSVSPTPGLGARIRDSSYRPVVAPARRAEDYLKVVLPRGRMQHKHDAAAPYHVFYTTITAAKQTHHQPYSITFLELLDASLGELQSSLQINFMVEPAWLLAQYYFAGYSAKKLTILYGEECDDMKQLDKKPHVDAVRVQMATPFGKHHTKLMLLCYEDGSVRVVVSTANLYQDDWDNRTQGLWFSPRCAPLPRAAPPHAGDSPTMFKRSLLKYLSHYRLPNLVCYTERVKRCDFSHINVFLVASVPGSHFDLEWGMARAGALLRQHCAVPADESRAWPLVAQASSLGSYGAEPKLWLTGDFLHHFTKVKTPPQTLTQPPPLQLIYPSLENVQRSHDGLLGGGCLPYAADCHAKQPWLNDYLYQWRAEHSCRSRAMPHIKSYCRCRDARAAFYLLTSANVSKAAWGSVNKGNKALRLMSYEAGVLLLPRLLINEDFFPLGEGAHNRLVIPYDLPPTKYSADMSPWVQDHLY
ncbi:probable tyrosyl-DNA phosphodiesterase [Maniola jurtina]|uniref:probable tyrosyl-DNA phosphodiesterase n=1 Tax=Maniola jurtina TaxID=191418 RepID=UPI001E68DEE2|nr:probable tyrosyl-DNA phosphodiesterase [Maniola jurtina]